MSADLPTSQQFSEALARITRDFGRRRGIASVELVLEDGQPLVVLHGSGPAEPPGMPHLYRMPLPTRPGAQPRFYHLRMEWRQAARRSNAQMWGGATPVKNLFPRLIVQGEDPRAPVNPEGVPDIEMEEEYQVSISARRPGFVAPNFWGKPFEVQGTVCIPTYKTWVPAFAHTVQQTSMVVITGASYEFNNCLTLLDQFQVKVAETGIGKMATWTDMYVSADPDPAFQFAFGGHCQPIPLFMIVDHDQTVTAQVQVLGQYPFPNTPSTPLGGCGTIYLHGFISKLVLPLDAGARPSDTGAQDGSDAGGEADITPNGVLGA